ncbi:MAG: hypothetical protein ACM3JJ_12660 [Hyphomicrobiales bacterium]
MPKLEQVQVRNPFLKVEALTTVSPPSTDHRVREFIAQKGLTFSVAKTSTVPWNYFSVPGTPWIVLTVDGHEVRENAMQTPDVLLERLVEGLSRDPGRRTS